MSSSSLVARLFEYTIVNSVFERYNTIKQSNALLKVGLERAENSAGNILLQPVLRKIGTSVDEKGCMVLDEIETKANGIKTFVSQRYTNSVVYALATKTICTTIGEKLLRKILPPSLNVTSPSPSQQLTSPLTIPSSSTDTHANATGIFPTCEYTPSPTTTMTTTSLFYSKEHMEAIEHIIDLIQYLADYVEVNRKALLMLLTGEDVVDLSESGESNNNNSGRGGGSGDGGVESCLAGDNKRTVIRRSGAGKEIIEQHIQDLTQLGTKKVVAVVSSITHVSQILHQLLSNTAVPDIGTIKQHLTMITVQTKNAVLKLTEQDLKSYISKVSSTSVHVLFFILESTLSLLPKPQMLRKAPYLWIGSGLLSWKDSLSMRLGWTPSNEAGPHKHVIIDNCEDFGLIIEFHLSISCGPILVLFTAGKDPETGEVWCPDCIKARPLLTPLYSIPNLTFIECVILRKGYSDNPHHFYKTHKDIKLSHVPTLIFWQKTKGPGKRLVEGELHFPQNIEEFKKYVENHKFPSSTTMPMPMPIPIPIPIPMPMPMPTMTTGALSLQDVSDEDDSEEESIEIIFVSTPEGSGCVDC